MNREEQEIERRQDIELESILTAIRAVINKSEVKTIARLAERCRNQATRIQELEKEVRELRHAKKIKAPDPVEVGSVLIDGFGRKYIVKTLGNQGFIDSNDERHHWGLSQYEVCKELK
jgi:antitoxin component HigA of HigAB toxin-antitoxin module